MTQLQFKGLGALRTCWRLPPSNGSSSDALNAPQTAVSWVAESMPDYRDGGRTFGDYPQVDITRETTNFAQKLRDYGRRNGINGLGENSANIRSVEELQRVSDFIAKRSANAGWFNHS